MVQPLILAAGIDPVWFGVFRVLMCEISLISPPVGYDPHGDPGGAKRG